MNHFKQHIWVVSILFISLMSAVALCYAITPGKQAKPQVIELQAQQEQPIKKILNISDKKLKNLSLLVK